MRTVTFLGLLAIADAIRENCYNSVVKQLAIIAIIAIIMDIIEFLNKLKKK